MAREQIQVPFDTNSNSDRDLDSSRPKELGRPRIASSLNRPVARESAKLYRHCSCGDKNCTYPAQRPGDMEYRWVYRNAVTHEEVVDTSLPARGSSEPGGLVNHARR